MLATIDAFLADPMNASSKPILGFTTRSPDVLVVVRQELLPVAALQVDGLHAAFAAGNVRAQLLSGKKEDRPVEGVRAMVAVYRKLQVSSPGLRIAELEDFAAREAAGTLESKVRSLVSGHHP